MNSRDFCFWLQGFFEIGEPIGKISERQVEMIKIHLELVFKHDIEIGTEKCVHQLPSIKPNDISSISSINTSDILIC